MKSLMLVKITVFNNHIEATIQVSGNKIRLSSKYLICLWKVIASEVYELTEDEIFEYQDKLWLLTKNEYHGSFNFI